MLRKLKEKTYYELLGISREASPADIERGFQEACRVYHPTVRYMPQATDTTLALERQQIYELVRTARDTLANPASRQVYDMALAKVEGPTEEPMVELRPSSASNPGILASASGLPTGNRGGRDHTPRRDLYHATPSSRPAAGDPMSHSHHSPQDFRSVSQILIHERKSSRRAVLIVILGAISGVFLGVLAVMVLRALF